MKRITEKLINKINNNETLYYISLNTEKYSQNKATGYADIIKPCLLFIVSDMSHNVHSFTVRGFWIHNLGNDVDHLGFFSYFRDDVIDRGVHGIIGALLESNCEKFMRVRK